MTVWVSGSGGTAWLEVGCCEGASESGALDLWPRPCPPPALEEGAFGCSLDWRDGDDMEGTVE
jgi:hypothetical protein